MIAVALLIILFHELVSVAALSGVPFATPLPPTLARLDLMDRSISAFAPPMSSRVTSRGSLVPKTGTAKGQKQSQRVFSFSCLQN